MSGSGSVAVLPLEKDVLGTFAAKVYTWMAGMLLLTAGSSLVAYKLGLVQWFQHHTGWFLVALLSELGLVMAYSWLRRTLTFFTGLGLLGVYTVLNGLTLSVMLGLYSLGTVAVSFLATTGIFVLASIYGFTTKKSLDSWGSWLLMGLFGLLGAMIGNFFLHSNPVGYLISGVGVILFTALAIYDANKIKEKGAESQTNLATLDCAMEVYLDFINLFLHVLRLFGINTGKD